MSQVFQVYVDPATLRMSAMGSITGALAVRIGGVWFPDAHWTDFVVIVLSWWCRQAAALRSGDPGRFDFMDGSPSFVVRPSGEGQAVIEDVTRRSDRATPLATEIDVASIVEAIESAGRTTVVACEAHGWRNSAIDDLCVWVR